MSKQSGSSNRWHDNRQELSVAVKLMEAFPEELQTIVADGIINLADKQFQVTMLFESLRTLGSDKVMSLYKSKNKRRSYDKNPVLHKAVNYLFVLSPGNQDFMAKQIIELSDQVNDYIKTCKQFYQAPSPGDVSKMTTIYVEVGAEEVKVFLSKVRESFESQVEMRGVQTLMEHQGDMRITERDR